MYVQFIHGRMIVCIVDCLQCTTRQNMKRKTINGVAIGSLAPVDPVHECMRERKLYLIWTPIGSLGLPVKALKCRPLATPLKKTGSDKLPEW